ncbi:integrase core domain-containing protein [uncultured Desulfovibrio sp.]
MDTWAQEYNEQRPHESLGNLAPQELALNHAGDSGLDLH